MYAYVKERVIVEQTNASERSPISMQSPECAITRKETRMKDRPFVRPFFASLFVPRVARLMGWVKVSSRSYVEWKARNSRIFESLSQIVGKEMK